MESDKLLTGFRLKTIELYNWGTFNQKIYRLDIEGDNALLTGDIGSGKSTIVDAVTTLLVPHQKITYNKAAGSSAKERTLYSYVVGEYKSTIDEGMGSSKAVALRDSRHYSVIMATFENQSRAEVVSVAQFFWTAAGNRQPNKLFVVAETALSIEKSFRNFGSIQELKKKLKATQKVELFTTFKEYSTHFRRLMQISSEQALNLFYQTVSMKSVGNLTSFVREQMLEEGDMESRIDALCENFNELNQAHNTVLRAKRQLEILTPIVTESTKYRRNLQSKESNENLRELLSGYFAQIKVGLMEEKLNGLQIKATKIESKIKQGNQEIERLDEQRFELKDELKRQGGDKLLTLAKSIEQQNLLRDSRKHTHSRYHLLSKSLGLPSVSNEHTFLVNQERIVTALGEIESKRKILGHDKLTTQTLFSQKRQSSYEIEAEIAFLRQRKSNIPKLNSDMRDAMAEELGIELPFVGELLRVNDKAWEGAIERVLRPFALSILVDESDYTAVSRYVDKTHLKGKLVYLKVSQPKAALPLNAEVNSLIHKIDIHAQTSFYNWLEQELYQQFDYTCVESLAEFRRYKKALTQNGQIKSNLVRHEKDDRFAINDRQRFILGWENREKLVTLQQELKKYQEQLRFLQEEIAQFHKQEQQLESQRDALRDLFNFESFEEMDWYSVAKTIENLKAQKEELEKSSDTIKTLEKALQDVEAAIKSGRVELSTLHQKQGKISSDIEKFMAEKQEAKELYEEKKATLIKYHDALDAYLKSQNITQIELHTIKRQEQSIRETIQNSIDLLIKKINRSSEKIIAAMQSYIKEFPTFTKDVDASLEAMGEFEKMHQQLKKDDLPKYEQKFKKLFREGTIQHFLTLKTRLEEEEKMIHRKIRLINDSLKAIEYNQGTFIELSMTKNVDSDIRGFKEDLKQALSGTVGGEESYDEAKFLQVKKIIERFNGRPNLVDVDKKWRKKVTDVRNWFNFGANENYFGDGSLKEFYSDSSGKSGGQKEKLAYTVLASSIAFAYGLEGENDRSFRFVVIDEAFGKGSDDSTRYGLELFKKLNLQLLVITPIQKINIIEPYIQSIHFVHNREGMDSSVVSLGIEEYLENRGGD